MVNDLIGTAAGFTAIGAALVAGIFFAFSTFVMAALGRLHPEKGIAAMQAINVTVLNPWFFAVFFGTALGSLGLALFGFLNLGADGSAYLVSGGLLYLIGCIGVTIVFNVPLNNALAAVEPGSPKGAGLWARYLTRWTRWNHVRTAAPLAAAALFMMAMR